MNLEAGIGTKTKLIKTSPKEKNAARSVINYIQYIQTINRIRNLCECRNCGNNWEMRPQNLMKGQGCPKCGRKRTGEKIRKTHSQFSKELKIHHTELFAVGKYRLPNKSSH